MKKIRVQLPFYHHELLALGQIRTKSDEFPPNIVIDGIPYIHNDHRGNYATYDVDATKLVAELDAAKARIAELEAQKEALIAYAKEKAEEITFTAYNPASFGVGDFESIADGLANIEDILPELDSSAKEG